MGNSHYLVFKDTQGLSGQEKQWLGIMQAGIQVEKDFFFGPHSLFTAARVLGKVPLPASGYFYNAYFIFDKPEHVLPFNPKGKGIGKYKNSACAGFTNTAANPTRPGSILVNSKEVLGANACHGWFGYNESVFYATKDGRIGIKRVKNVYELCNHLRIQPKDFIFAIGGCGLINHGDPNWYNPNLEGFKRVKIDGVWRNYRGPILRNDHMVYGIDQWGYAFIALFKDKTPEEIIKILKNMGVTYAVLGDGGGWAAIHGDGVKINPYKPQWNCVQMTGGN